MVVKLFPNRKKSQKGIKLSETHTRVPAEVRGISPGMVMLLSGELIGQEVMMSCLFISNLEFKIRGDLMCRLTLSSPNLCGLRSS